MTTPVDEFMDEQGGLSTIKFGAPGATLAGDLVEARVGVQRVYGTNTTATWDDGTPKKQLQLDVKVDRGESNDVTVGQDDDTDVGVVYAKHQLKLAIQEACSEAGVKLSQVGRIRIRRLDDGAPPKPGFNPVQRFKAKVEKAVNTSADDLDSWD